MRKRQSMIPFNNPYTSDLSKEYVLEALNSHHQQGDGPFSKRAANLISSLVGGGDVLMTPSCTHALEMASMLAGIGPGDEVIMPSFTFTSAATAVTQFGGVPVFIDIEPHSLGINAELIENAITPKTKAISWVNYAGIAPNIDLIIEIATKHDLVTIEDNAHGLGATYKNKPLGSFGDFSTLSFHATKNLQCGEGGAIIINKKEYLEKALIIREKGTNRHELISGKVQKYNWVGKGSSYLLAEVLAAILTGQFEEFDKLQKTREDNWNQIKIFTEKVGSYKRIINHNSNEKGSFHMFALEFIDEIRRLEFQESLAANNVLANTHYEPLHNSMAGVNYGRTFGGMEQTLSISSKILRLPLWTRSMAHVFEDYGTALNHV
jgi:dTDP-4-amino-4,6-dideoxygalactose transaminase